MPICKARKALIERQNEKMWRALYGPRSERARQLIDQLELAFEELEASASEDEAHASLAMSRPHLAVSIAEEAAV